jgi:hypothetical protein
MRGFSRHLAVALAAACVLLCTTRAAAQDLDPRAYAWVPVNTTILVAGLGLSDGSVVTDVASPIQDLTASVQTPSLGVGRVFALGRGTAQAFAAVPYSWAQVSGLVVGQGQSITRSGLSDMRLRFSWLFRGAPPSNAGTIARAPRRTILGTSLNVVVPTGQYDPAKLINLGTARWAVRPELAISHPVGQRWLVDVYAGLWLFTDNDAFYPGTSVRSQEPLGTLQAHISYSVQPLMWVAFDATFYAGGMTSLDGVQQDDRQSNSRIGATLVFPVGQRNSMKIAVSTGAVVRSGANFNTLSVGWQRVWLARPPATAP